MKRYPVIIETRSLRTVLHVISSCVVFGFVIVRESLQSCVLYCVVRDTVLHVYDA